MSYYDKYIKYKNKYLELKGGSEKTKINVLRPITFSNNNLIKFDVSNTNLEIWNCYIDQNNERKIVFNYDRNYYCFELFNYILDDFNPSELYPKELKVYPSELYPDELKKVSLTNGSITVYNHNDNYKTERTIDIELKINNNTIDLNNCNIHKCITSKNSDDDTIFTYNKVKLNEFINFLKYKGRTSKEYNQHWVYLQLLMKINCILIVKNNDISYDIYYGYTQIFDTNK